MRTPKIEALPLRRAINWFNQFDNCNIDCLGLDFSPIDSNGWLAGFTDGDGNFSITLTGHFVSKKNGTTTGKRVQTFFRLELRQNYHSPSPFGATPNPHPLQWSL
jgi:LAGLIDADG DNA endonuclease family protein